MRDQSLNQRLVASRAARARLLARIRADAAAAKLPKHQYTPAGSAGGCMYDGLPSSAPIHDLSTYTETEKVEDAADATSGAPADGVMVALFPSTEVAERLAVKDGEPVDQLHVTLAFLGKADSIGDRTSELRDAVEAFAKTHHGLTGEVSGRGLFTAGPKPVTYASVDVPALAEFRQQLVRALESAGFPVMANHGYTPHMTLAYGDLGSHDVPNVPLGFDSITLAIAGSRWTYPLRGVAELSQDQQLAARRAEVESNVLDRIFKIPVGKDAKGERARTLTKGEKPHKYQHPISNDSLMESPWQPNCTECNLPVDDRVHEYMQEDEGDASNVPVDIDDDGTPDNSSIGVTLRPNGGLKKSQKGPAPGSLTASEKAEDWDQAHAAKVMQGIDAGIDQALVLLRSVNNDIMPEYAQQARDLLQALEEACDGMLEYFGVPDADEPDDDAEPDGDPDDQVAKGADANGPLGEKVDIDKKPVKGQPKPLLTDAKPLIVSEPLRIDTDPVTGEPIDPNKQLLTGEPTQRAFISELNGHTLLTGPVNVTNHWEKALTPNQHVMWIQGRFVGGEKANRNGAFWSTADLEFGQPTVQHGPLNWLHESRHIIGSIADSKLVIPGETAAEGDVTEPHIVTAAGIWTWIYPDEAYVVEQASDSNRLWQSMECISDKVVCVGDGGCGHETPYFDYVKGKATCAHMTERSAHRRFRDPTFLGGAVIVPPVRPGWADADTRLIRANEEFIERSFAVAQPDVNASEWEAIMAGLLRYAGVQGRVHPEDLERMAA